MDGQKIEKKHCESANNVLMDDAKDDSKDNESKMFKMSPKVGMIVESKSEINVLNILKQDREFGVLREKDLKLHCQMCLNKEGYVYWFGRKNDETLCYYVKVLFSDETSVFLPFQCFNIKEENTMSFEQFTKLKMKDNFEMKMDNDWINESNEMFSNLKAKFNENGIAYCVANLERFEDYIMGSNESGSMDADLDQDLDAILYDELYDDLADLYECDNADNGNSDTQLKQVTFNDIIKPLCETIGKSHKIEFDNDNNKLNNNTTQDEAFTRNELTLLKSEIEIDEKDSKLLKQSKSFRFANVITRQLIKILKQSYGNPLQYGSYRPEIKINKGIYSFEYFENHCSLFYFWTVEFGGQGNLKEETCHVIDASFMKSLLEQGNKQAFKEKMRDVTNHIAQLPHGLISHTKRGLIKGGGRCGVHNLLPMWFLELLQ